MISVIEMSDFISCIFIGIVFLLLIELRYSKKVTIISSFLFVILIFSVYLMLLSRGMDEGAAAAVSLTIPSFIFCLMLAKAKDSRFIFTFCTVDLMGFIIIIVSRVIAMPFNDNSTIILVTMTIGFSVVIFAILKYRDRYLQIQRTLTSGWRSLAVASVLYYVMLYMIISYPSPMIDRREYLPVAILFCFILIVVYIVIYQTVMKGIRIYNEQNERALLEKEIELQKSQLELKEVYHKMAYTDTMTNLKNRTAFEEKKEVLNNICKSNGSLSCLSMDLNNLKEINDFYGHNAGDELLIAFSNILKKSFANLEDIYRIGGDEFILFLIGIPRDEVKNEIRNLKREICQYNSQHKIKIDVAMGLVSMNDKDNKDIKNIKNIHSIITDADAKMYKNKKRMKSESFM